MTIIFLQIWGGSFYLLNKICFSQVERSTNTIKKHRWQIRCWIIYLLGLPAWVIVFIIEHNWIAAAVESGGAPAMLMGLVMALKGKGSESKWLDYIARGSILAGLTMSIVEFGGIKTSTQFLELGIAAGFLMGTYLLAKDNIQGYFWLMLGNVACSALMGVQGYYLLMTQQLVSLIFVIDACVNRKKGMTQ